MLHGTSLHEEKTQEAGKVSYFIDMPCIVSYGLKQCLLEVGGKFINSRKREERGGEERRENGLRGGESSRQERKRGLERQGNQGVEKGRSRHDPTRPFYQTACRLCRNSMRCHPGCAVVGTLSDTVP